MTQASEPQVTVSDTHVELVVVAPPLILNPHHVGAVPSKTTENEVAEVPVLCEGSLARKLIVILDETFMSL